MVTKTQTHEAVTKTAGGKKRSAQTSKRVLTRAYGDQCFWMNDGKVLADLVELERALKEISKDTFAYHVSADRNDFADWVEFVLADAELAHTLRDVKTALKTRALVVKRLTIYEIQ